MTKLEISNFIPTRDNRYAFSGGSLPGPDIHRSRTVKLSTLPYMINPSLHCTIWLSRYGEVSYLKTLSNAKVLLRRRQVYISMQNWWNDTNRVEPKLLKKKKNSSTNLSTTNPTWRGQIFTAWAMSRLSQPLTSFTCVPEVTEHGLYSRSYFRGFSQSSQTNS